MNNGEDPENILLPFGVSRETLERLERLVAELRVWQKAKNLVGPATLETVWSRHIADSLQLRSVSPADNVWLDLGSGAGFPGIVLAIALGDRPGARVHCVESNSRKCAFIRHAARVTEAPVTVHDARIEDVAADFAERVDVVTARALAPLAQLLAWTAPLLTTGTIGVFPKGDNVSEELTEARKYWKFEVETFPSRTDPRGRILKISGLEPTQPSS
jgi:16S rRNA (guanine527-N7)-methyltransferase